MLVDCKARILLGFPPNSCPTPSQVKAAYKRKVLETHPDRFPDHEKSDAESKFKSIAEAYTILLSDVGKNRSSTACYSRVVRRGVPTSRGGKGNQILIGVPFFLIIMSTVALGGLNASRAYKRQKETYPSSHNPFLP